MISGKNKLIRPTTIANGESLTADALEIKIQAIIKNK